MNDQGNTGNHSFGNDICSICGSLLERDMQFCVHCGARVGTKEKTTPAFTGSQGTEANPPRAVPGNVPIKKKKNIIPIVVTVASVAMVAIAVLILLNPFGRENTSQTNENSGTQSAKHKEIEMPDLVNQHFSQAENVLDSLGLGLDIIEEQVAGEVEKGLVIKTLPEAGEALASGYQVVIYISAGPEITEETVPDLLGSTREQVEFAFWTLGITPVFHEFPDESPIGTVLYIERVGERVVIPASITVHISSGKQQTAAVTQPQTPTTTAYSVQVMSYRIYENALKARDDLRADGYDAYITYNQVVEMYKVHIGRFSARQDALSMLEYLQSIGYDDAFLIEAQFS